MAEVDICVGDTLYDGYYRVLEYSRRNNQSKRGMINISRPAAMGGQVTTDKVIEGEIS